MIITCGRLLNYKGKQNPVPIVSDLIIQQDHLRIVSARSLNLTTQDLGYCNAGRGHSALGTIGVKEGEEQRIQTSG